MGLPPDRAPRDDDWAWLNALAGHPEPDTEKRVLRETKLLAEALKDAIAGVEPPRDDLMARFAASSSLSAQDFDESSKMGLMASIEPSFERTDRIGSRASGLLSRDSSDDDRIYPEPTGKGFAALKRRLQDAGLL